MGRAICWQDAFHSASGSWIAGEENFGGETALDGQLFGWECWVATLVAGTRCSRQRLGWVPANSTTVGAVTDRTHW